MYIGLSTCPTHASGNVGDKLITDSMIKLLKEEKQDIEIKTYFRREDFTSRLDLINKAEGILLFGFPIVNNIIPTIYRFVEDLDLIESPIVPIGAIYKFFPGEKELLKYKSVNKTTKKFIDRIVPNCPNNEIPVRTEWVGKFLEYQGYNTTLTGDPAWYDPEYIGESFHCPNEINQLVFTPPHNNIYLKQGKKLLKKLSDKYSDAKKIVSFQSALKDTDREIRKVAKKHDWKVKYTSHDTNNIEFYRESDLHIGYRKHGHLAHLRWRRPSVVLAEDSRSMGLTDTLGTAGFPAFESRFSAKVTHQKQHSRLFKALKSIETTRICQKLGIKHRKVAKQNPKVISEILQFLDTQMENNWKSYNKIQKKIDETYHNKMKTFVGEILST